MSKRPPPNLSALSLAPTPVEPAAAPVPQQPALPKPKDANNKGRLATTLYLHPEGHRALKVRAFETETTMLDLIHEALEEWVAAKGIRAKIRPE